jgi:hypothetical protein
MNISEILEVFKKVEGSEASTSLLIAQSSTNSHAKFI